MSVKDITADAVLAAVQAGYDDIDKPAGHFRGVAAGLGIYRVAVELIVFDRLVLANPEGWATEATRWVVA